MSLTIMSDIRLSVILLEGVTYFICFVLSVDCISTLTPPPQKWTSCLYISIYLKLTQKGHYIVKLSRHCLLFTDYTYVFLYFWIRKRIFLLRNKACNEKLPSMYALVSSSLNLCVIVIRFLVNCKESSLAKLPLLMCVSPSYENKLQHTMQGPSSMPSALCSHSKSTAALTCKTVAV